MNTAVQLPLPFDPPSKPAPPTLVVGSCNEAAWQWLGRWPDWPGRVLIVHGPAGCGKTSLAALWGRRARAYQGGAGDVGAIIAQHVATPESVAIDNADTIAGDAAAERDLLHLHNLVVEAGKWLMLTGQTAPARWPIELPDLASRLRAAPSVAVGLPDDALLDALLVKLFAERQLVVDAGIIEFLKRRMERSYAAARDLVARIDTASLSRKQAVTTRLVAAVLSDDQANED